MEVCVLLLDRIKQFSLACQEEIFSELDASFGPLPRRYQLLAPALEMVHLETFFLVLPETGGVPPAPSYIDRKGILVQDDFPCFHYHRPAGAMAYEPSVLISAWGTLLPYQGQLQL